MNKLLLVGKLTNKFKKREAGEHEVITFVVETKGFGDYPDRITISAWNKLVPEVVACVEGSLVSITARVNTRKNKKTEAYETLVTASEFEQLTKDELANAPAEDVTPDEIPF